MRVTIFWVDDLAIAASIETELQAIKDSSSDWFLAIQLARYAHGFRMCQSKYLTEVITNRGALYVIQS